MNKLIAAMWHNRGYSPEFFQEISRCDHKRPENIDAMCARLKHYHDTQERVVLLTDFDMDGIMSGVVGFAAMAELGFNVALYLPSTDSYGFDETDIQKIQQEYTDVKAIVTADVGISAFDGVRYGMNQGIEMLVTDHHQPSGNFVSPSSVFVNPVCDKGNEYFGGICGAHVLYLVMHRYAELYTDSFMVSQIDRLRVFAGFGTVSDSMPLWYENRPLIQDSVSICRLIYSNDAPDIVNMLPGCEIYRRAFAGLFVAMKAFHEAGKISDSTSIDETFFGYYMAPAFNSIKRMGERIELAYKVFFGGPAVAEEAMNYIMELTETRKDVVNSAMDAILADDANQPYAPYIYITNAIAGVRGLMAQRVMSLTGEPALVVGSTGDGGFVGSGRCPFWFPFLEISGPWPDVHAAGHNPAFGVALDSADACAAAVERIKKEIENRKPDEADLAFKPDFTISTLDPNADTDIDVELFSDFLDEIDRYRPFGTDFPEPEATLEFNPKDAIWTYLGKDKNHIKVALPHGLVLLCFNQAGYFPEKIQIDKMPSSTVVRGRLNMNEWGGIRTVQFLGTLGEDMDQSDSIVDGLFDSDVSDDVPVMAF